MKCAYHPEADATASCMECGKFICAECSKTLANKVYCPACADRLFVEGRRQTWKPVVGGILGTLAGIAGLIGGPKLLGGGWGIVVAAISIVAIVGSVNAIYRRNFGLALAGGICSVISGGVLGAVALVLIVLSRDEFPSSNSPT